MNNLTEEQKEKRRQAVKRHEMNVDRVNCRLPLGTKERIRKITGMSCDAFIKQVVVQELERIEKEQN